MRPLRRRGAIVRLERALLGRRWLSEMLSPAYLPDEELDRIPVWLPEGSLGLIVANECNYSHLINPRDRWRLRVKQEDYAVMAHISGQGRLAVTLVGGAPALYQLPWRQRPSSRLEKLLLVFRRWLEDQDWRPVEPTDSELEELFLAPLRQGG